MSIFQYIDSLEDLVALRRVYNNLPSEAHLLGLNFKLSHEDAQRAKIYALERINFLKEVKK